MEKQKTATTDKSNALSLLVFTVDWGPECGSLMLKIKKITEKYKFVGIECRL